MPSLVEDAGGELAAGHLFKCAHHLGKDRGTDTLGGRAVAWELAPGGVRVAHPPADPGGESAAYLLAVLTTALPSGGVRRWWACPGCGLRVDALYLPPGRDRLGCRRCCSLRYQSQYAPGPVAHRKKRPAIWVETTTQRWGAGGATGRLVLAASRTSRRRL